jgi:hypothetical protein
MPTVLTLVPKWAGAISWEDYGYKSRTMHLVEDTR